jgi:uncharacterized protein YbcI
VSSSPDYTPLIKKNKTKFCPLKFLQTLLEFIRLLGGKNMGKKETAFNDIVRKMRKDIFGKGPERIFTHFVENMAVTTMYGILTPTEKFIAQSQEGKKVIHSARTEMIREIYKQKVPEGMEELVGSKLLHLFSDAKIEEDMAVSVFIFDKPIV